MTQSPHRNHEGSRLWRNLMREAKGYDGGLVRVCRAERGEGRASGRRLTPEGPTGVVRGRIVVPRLAAAAAASAAAAPPLCPPLPEGESATGSSVPCPTFASSLPPLLATSNESSRGRRRSRAAEPLFLLSALPPPPRPRPRLPGWCLGGARDGLAQSDGQAPTESQARGEERRVGRARGRRATIAATAEPPKDPDSPAPSLSGHHADDDDGETAPAKEEGSGEGCTVGWKCDSSSSLEARKPPPPRAGASCNSTSSR